MSNVLSIMVMGSSKESDTTESFNQIGLAGDIFLTANIISGLGDNHDTLSAYSIGVLYGGVVFACDIFLSMMLASIGLF